MKEPGRDGGGRLFAFVEDGLRLTAFLVVGCRALVLGHSRLYESINAAGLETV
jgi:hypothetical protein